MLVSQMVALPSLPWDQLPDLNLNLHLGKNKTEIPVLVMYSVGHFAHSGSHENVSYSHPATVEIDKGP